MELDNIVISRKIFSGEKNCKYFIGSIDDDHKIKPLFIMLSKTHGYVKSCDCETKWMYFLFEEDGNIWNKVRNNIKKKFERETIYNKNFWKLKHKLMCMKQHIFMMKILLK